MKTIELDIVSCYAYNSNRYYFSFMRNIQIDKFTALCIQIIQLGLFFSFVDN